jgi:hypothetical protein
VNGEYWSSVDGIEFDESITTTTWHFGSGTKVTIEHGDSGFFIYGSVGGKSWHDEDHEDFFCATTDDLLVFLEKHGLLSMLSVKE